jgi:hypothetical protein
MMISDPGAPHRPGQAGSNLTVGSTPPAPVGCDISGLGAPRRPAMNRELHWRLLGPPARQAGPAHGAGVSKPPPAVTTGCGSLASACIQAAPLQQPSPAALLLRPQRGPRPQRAAAAAFRPQSSRLCRRPAISESEGHAKPVRASIQTCIAVCDLWVFFGSFTVQSGCQVPVAARSFEVDAVSLPGSLSLGRADSDSATHELGHSATEPSGNAAKDFRSELDSLSRDHQTHS